MTTRDRPGIAEEQLRACLQEQYDLVPATLEFLPLGLDYDAGVYRLVSEQGTPYLLKATSRPLYEAAYLVPGYLSDHGITSVVAPLPTIKKTLWSQVGTWRVIVYPFIDGDTSWVGMTDEQWRRLGTIFQQIHQVVLPTSGFESVRRETFDTTEYSRWIDAFESQHLQQQNQGSDIEKAARSSWKAHRPTIHAIVTAMEKLAAALQKQSGPYVICHSDLHAANLIRDRAGQVFVIDWDEVMLAPKERDFLFTGNPPADASSDIPPFFQGYGQIQTDWIALTYYHYERRIQDVIACAENVFKKDMGERNKAIAAYLLQKNLEGSNERVATAEATAHLPSDIRHS